MNTVDHYLCNSHHAAMPVDGDKPHEALSNAEIDALVDDWMPERDRIAALERERDELREEVDRLKKELQQVSAMDLENVLGREGLLQTRDTLEVVTKERDELRTRSRQLAEANERAIEQLMATENQLGIASKQLAAVTRERDEIAKRFLGVEPAGGGKWGLFYEGVKPMYETSIAACEVAHKMNCDQLAMHQNSETDLLSSAE